MKKAALFLFLISPAVQAEDLVLDVDTIIDAGHRYEAIFRIKNNSRVNYKLASVQCAWINTDEKAIHLGIDNVANIKPGETAFGQADGPKIGGPKAARVDCRISNALK